MKRRGFLGRSAAAIAGAFVVTNPKILDNGLVVPSEAYQSDHAELVDVPPEQVAAVVPKEEAKPLTLATSEPMPGAARFVGYLSECNLTVSRPAYEVSSFDSPYSQYVSGPVSAELQMRLTGGEYGMDALSGAMNDGEEIEVYLVRRKRVARRESELRSNLRFTMFNTGTISIDSPTYCGGTAMIVPGGRNWPIGT